MCIETRLEWDDDDDDDDAPLKSVSVIKESAHAAGNGVVNLHQTIIVATDRSEQQQPRQRRGQRIAVSIATLRSSASLLFHWAPAHCAETTRTPLVCRRLHQPRVHCFPIPAEHAGADVNNHAAAVIIPPNCHSRAHKVIIMIGPMQPICCNHYKSASSTI
jgi:hypothetical protein